MITELFAEICREYKKRYIERHVDFATIDLLSGVLRDADGKITVDTGICFPIAKYVVRRLGENNIAARIRLLWLNSHDEYEDDIWCHAVVEHEGRFYDVFNTEGVDHWGHLYYVRGRTSLYLSEPGDAADNVFMATYRLSVVGPFASEFLGWTQ